MSTSQKISVLLTGSELMDGRVQDTNAHYILNRCNEESISVVHVLFCDDEERNILNSLQYLCLHSDAVVISGGLGPTTDDLTRETVAAFAQTELRKDEAILTALKVRYEKRGRTFNSNNEKQAYFPSGSTVIPNPVGTAAGFTLSLPYQEKVKKIFSLPGVPHELKTMFEESVLPALIDQRENRAKAGFRLFGMAESAVGLKIQEMQLPRSIEVSYRAALPEVHVLFKTKDTGISIEQVATKAKSILGPDYIFSNDLSVGLPEHVYKLLLKHGTLSVAESCTGGMVGSLLTEIPGASQYFNGGVIAYSNSLKEDLLGVPSHILASEGAVSSLCAAAMAQGVRNRCKSSFGVSITGISGPDGGTEEKPVGTFFVGIANSTTTTVIHYHAPFERKLARRFEAFAALELIRRHLEGVPYHKDDFIKGIKTYQNQ